MYIQKAGDDWWSTRMITTLDHIERRREANPFRDHVSSNARLNFERHFTNAGTARKESLFLRSFRPGLYHAQFVSILTSYFFHAARSWSVHFSFCSGVRWLTTKWTVSDIRRPSTTRKLWHACSNNPLRGYLRRSWTILISRALSVCKLKFVYRHPERNSPAETISCGIWRFLFLGVETVVKITVSICSTYISFD